MTTLLVLLAVLAGTAVQKPATPVHVVIETEAGEIEAEIDIGMDVVRTIQMGPANGETLTPPIAILRVRRR